MVLTFSSVCLLLCLKIISQQRQWSFYGSWDEARLSSQGHWHHSLSGWDAILLEHAFYDLLPHFPLAPLKLTPQWTFSSQPLCNRFYHFLSSFLNHPWYFSVLLSGIFFLIVFFTILTNIILFFNLIYGTCIILHFYEYRILSVLFLLISKIN